MEKNSMNKEVFKNLSRKKFLYSIVIFLVILSGFLLFNQISYLNSVYDTKIVKSHTKVIIFINFTRTYSLINLIYSLLNNYFRIIYK
jgi:hypothetical protein